MMLLARLLRRTVGAVAFGVVAVPIGAQVVVVDEGILTITVAGERVGREDFSIRRNVADGGFIAQGNVLRGDSRSEVALTTDSTGLPLRFQIKRFVAGRQMENTSGEYRRGLWSGRTEGPTGESGREFRLPETLLAADDGVIHHAWFLVRFIRQGAVLVLRPRELAARPMVIESGGPDSVAFGLDWYDAVRWIVRDGVGGAVLREVWADAGGRLLRVRVPSADLDATRDEPPPGIVRETPPQERAYDRPEPLLTGFGLDAFAVACDPAPRIGDAVGGPSGTTDVDVDRSARDREEEQSHVSAVGDRTDARRGVAPLGLRRVTP